MRNTRKTITESNSRGFRALFIIAMVSAAVYFIPDQALANDNLYRGLSGAAQLYNQMDQQARQERVQGEQRVYQNYLRRQQIRNQQQQYQQPTYQQQYQQQMRQQQFKGLFN